MERNGITVKQIVSHLVAILYTSSWWACAMWPISQDPSTKQETTSILWFPPIFFTIVLFILFVKYCVEHWED